MRDPNWEQKWGQVKTYGPRWVEGERNPVLNLPAELRPPQVVTVTLGAEIVGPNREPVGGFSIFRWAIKTGIGGAAREWLIDSRPLQQVSFPSNTTEISILAERTFTVGTNPPAYQNPDCIVRASAFLGVGNTSTERASLSSYARELLGVNQAIFFAPPGACAFRIVGATRASAGGTDSPFQAGTLIGVGSSFLLTGLWDGPELEALQASGDYIPLPGGATSITFIGSGSGSGSIRNFGVQWGIDL